MKVLRVALYSDWLLVKESIPYCLFFTVFTSKQPARAAYQVGNLPKVINISSIRKFTFFFLFLSRVVEGKAPRVHLAPLCLEKVILFTKGVSIECLETKNQSTRYITQGANENSK